MIEALPMFPLGIALLPGELLPLRIFEPRYRRMVADCLQAADPAFGTVLIDRGSEVGGGDVRRNVGVRARFMAIDELDDGTLTAVAVGLERIRVVAWLDDDPYPRADVEPWPEDDPDDAAEIYREARPLGAQDRFDILRAGDPGARRAAVNEALETREMLRRFGRDEPGR